MFVVLVVALSAKKVIAKQDEPYGDIHIVPGQKYEEEAQEDLSSDWQKIIWLLIIVSDNSYVHFLKKKKKKKHIWIKTG